MRIRKGFTLIEMIMAVVVLGILMSVAIPRFQNQFERMRGAEARETLLQAYAGYARLIADGGVINGANPLTWGRMGMTNPNADAEGFFNYTINNPGNPSRIDAFRIGNGSNAVRVTLSTGKLQTWAPY